jgi:hypothetical protein
LSIQKKYIGKQNRNSFDERNSGLDMREKTGTFHKKSSGKIRLALEIPGYLKHSL